MSWVRLDDHIDENPKIAAVGPLGLALFVAALAYSNRNLTDGYVPAAVARTLLAWDGPTGKLYVSNGDDGQDVDAELVIRSLLGAGLWKKVKGGYLIHDRMRLHYFR